MARKRQDPQPSISKQGIWKASVPSKVGEISVEIDLTPILNEFMWCTIKWFPHKPDPTIEEIRSRTMMEFETTKMMQELLPEELSKLLTFAFNQTVEKTIKRTMREGERQKIFVREGRRGPGRPPGSTKKAKENEQNK